ncbi:hypothetical protein [Varibaculum vaginae]|uniref:hypothetical protein n=1 Tax=Varibaculum vaginae TaxID=2364797 RepID=UPI000F075DC7|nr:hypothetical protein [Varibaculum vaginae]
MSIQLSFDLEELAQKRVVGLGDYQLLKQTAVKTQRPRLQLVDATYIERVRAKTRHPAGSKLPCPPAVGRENRTDVAEAAFDSLPSWVRRTSRINRDCSVSLAAVPPAAQDREMSAVRRSASPKKKLRGSIFPAISRRLAKVSMLLVLGAGALMVGAALNSFWDFTTVGHNETFQVSEGGVVAGNSSSSADLLLGQ